MTNQLRSILFLLMLCLVSCSYTRYYVVRHGEKADQTADDSPLSEDGFIRAQTLADTMANKHINRIYVSDKIRTQQTAARTATLFGLKPIIIPKPDTDQLIAKLKRESRKNVLVVRHSEELHLIVNALSPYDQITQIGDEYHHLFLITRRVFLWQRKYTLKRLSYGNQ